jgi:hypothetical protein
MTRTVEELRKIAEAATPGPWSALCNAHKQLVQEVDAQGRWGLYVADTSMLDQGWENAAFIATFNPAFVRELLSSYSQMREALEEYERVISKALERGDLGYSTLLVERLDKVRVALSLNPTTGEMKETGHE